MTKCPRCGYDNESDAAVCSSCLQPLSRPVKHPSRRPGIAAFLSAMILVAVMGAAVALWVRSSSAPATAVVGPVQPAPSPEAAPVQEIRPAAPPKAVAESERREAREARPPVPEAPTEAIDQWRDRYKKESKNGQAHSTITNDELRMIAKNPGGRTTAVQKPPEPKPQTTQAPQDLLTLISAQIVGKEAKVRISYHLSAQRSRPVYAAARVIYTQPDLSFFSYGAEPLAPGSREAAITVPVGSGLSSGSARPTAVRLMLFEAKGAMVFAVDVPWP